MTGIARMLLTPVAFMLLAGVAQGSLPASPLDLRLSASSVYRGEPVGIRVTQVAHPDPRFGSKRFDLYLMSVFSPAAKFLTPAGRWSSERVTFRGDIDLAHFTPIVTEWSDTARAGWISPGLVLVRAGSDPLDWATWEFQPVLRWVRVSDRSKEDHASLVVLAGLAVLTMAGAGVVLVYPRAKS